MYRANKSENSGVNVSLLIFTTASKRSGLSHRAYRSVIHKSVDFPLGPALARIFGTFICWNLGISADVSTPDQVAIYSSKPLRVTPSETSEMVAVSSSTTAFSA